MIFKGWYGQQEPESESHYGDGNSWAKTWYDASEPAAESWEARFKDEAGAMQDAGLKVPLVGVGADEEAAIEDLSRQFSKAYQEYCLKCGREEEAEADFCECGRDWNACSARDCDSGEEEMHGDR